MYSCVYFARSSSNIHHWYYDEEGKKQYKKESAPLYFYTQDDNGEYTSIYGQRLKKIEFENYTKFKEAREMFKSAGRDLFESDVDPENRFILDTYSTLNMKKPKFDIHFVDIEVHSEEGFPEPEKAEHPITIITTYSTKYKKFIVLTYKEFDRNFIPEGETKPLLTDRDVVKIYKSEKEMLDGYIKMVQQLHPDFISGWNSSGYEDKTFFSNGFDIPYIINRINIVFEDDSYSKKLSPLKLVTRYEREHKSGKQRITYNIVGINLIDYLDLYKKYHQGEQESFKLDYIAKVEIQSTKVKFEGSLKELYHKNWQKYVEYNIQDVNILRLLDEKLQFMDMMIGICQNCRCSYDQFSKTTRVLDGAFISRLSVEKIVLPDTSLSHSFDDQYVGAFVKEPTPGVYDWVVSFDATSLYPSVMMQHNISPETKVLVIDQNAALIVMDALEGKKIGEDELSMSATENYDCRGIIKLIKENKYTIASNGVIYRHDKIGIVPRFVKEWFDNRKKHKDLMEKAQNEGNKDEEKLQFGLQLNYKILINSVYGALGSKYFRLYDKDNATAVTLTAQEIIKTAQGSMDSFFMNWESNELGKKLNAKNLSISPIIYGDTDSFYFNGGIVLKSFNYPEFQNIEVTKKFVENNIEKWMQKIIDKAMKQLTIQRMNCIENKIFFKREMIARKVAFLAKKRYSAWVLKMEKKDIKEGSDHELETKGHEMVKSVVPEKIRELMRSFVLEMLKTGDKKHMDDVYKKYAEEFKNLPIKNVCKIQNVNNLEKYSDELGEPIKGCPGHVKAALGYNKMLERRNLLDTYEKIQEGEKIKIIYLKDNPYYRDKAIAFKDYIPTEFNLKEFVDYDIMWNTVFEKPIKPFYTIQNWQLPDLGQDDISDLFS